MHIVTLGIVLMWKTAQWIFLHYGDQKMTQNAMPYQQNFA